MQIVEPVNMMIHRHGVWVKSALLLELSPEVRAKIISSEAGGVKGFLVPKVQMLQHRINAWDLVRLITRR